MTQPTNDDSSPQNPAETTQIAPSCSYSRPRRNPGPAKFKGEKRIVDKVSPPEKVDLAKDSDEEPLIWFIPAKELQGKFQLDSPS